ncbi:MAG: tyrosine protein phosphatase [Candidatus Ochrobactrum gambitense]|nr:MAG: tyrosine protein phosphatase [Candidatus Ochrobactrum gambitense]WEK17078.1 MAG: tyrosine protein phosphatase [Candidatus Ochrobactrum gambitense]
MTLIVVSPLSQLAAQLEHHRPSHVVTLTSGEVPALPESSAAQRLVLTFNDIIEPREGMVAPDASHVQALLDFVQAWQKDAPLLIHCYAGISRSTAAAYIAAMALNPQSDETALALELRKQSPSATPNIRLIEIADEILGRHGRMGAAIKLIGRGAEAFEGEVFSLPVRV